MSSRKLLYNKDLLHLLIQLIPISTTEPASPEFGFELLSLRPRRSTEKSLSTLVSCSSHSNVVFAGGRQGYSLVADGPLPPRLSPARQRPPRGAAGWQVHLPGVPTHPRRPALPRPAPAAVAGARGEAALPADGGVSASVPRPGHRAQRSQAEEVRLRRLSEVSLALYFIVWLK